MKDDREKLIVATLDKIRHFLQRDGGDVEFVSFEEGVVYVRLHGACQDCAYANNNIKDLENKPNYKFVKGDITDREFIYDLFEKEKFDVVINFAAESHVDRSIENPSIFLETNIIGTSVLMDACRKYGIKRYHQVSTDEVYGSLGKSGFFTENTNLSPNSPYSSSKASADLLVRSFFKTYKKSTVLSS